MRKLLFLDFETTGLDPSRDRILEVGALFVDAKTLAQEWCYSRCVYVPEDEVRALADEKVMKMHTENGLLAECANPNDALPLADIEHDLVKIVTEWLTNHDLADERPVIAGFGPHFDLNVARAQMPELAKLLHYRTVNVSTYRDCTKVWCPGAVEESESNHRALSDCVQALHHLRNYKLITEAGVAALLGRPTHD